MNGNIDFFTDNRQLINGGGTVNVSGDQKDFFAVSAEFQCEFTGSCGFSASGRGHKVQQKGFFCLKSFAEFFRIFVIIFKNALFNFDDFDFLHYFSSSQILRSML